jgi:UTP--glucose-1-phosphate uridylyltransferase
MGLGHAVLCAKNLVGNEPFAVFLGDDIIDARVPAMKQMLRVFKKYSSSVLAVQRVPKSQAHLYGVIKAEKVSPRVYRVLDLAEKPKRPIGRYILTPEIFDAIEGTRPGRGGEIQLTDAVKDAGDKIGFLKANVALALKRPEMRAELKRFLKGIKL